MVALSPLSIVKLWIKLLGQSQSRRVNRAHRLVSLRVWEIIEYQDWSVSENERYIILRVLEINIDTRLISTTLDTVISVYLVSLCICYLCVSEIFEYLHTLWIWDLCKYANSECRVESPGDNINTQFSRIVFIQIRR